MLEVNYASGEPMRIGDHVKLFPPLTDRMTVATIKTIIFPFDERWQYLGYKNPGIQFADELGAPLFSMEFLPVPDKTDQWFTSADFSAEFREKWNCVHFVERGDVCYYTGESVKPGDVVAIECGYDAKCGGDKVEIGCVVRIVLPSEKNLMQVPLNSDGIGLLDLGVLIAYQHDPKTVRWVQQVVDENGGYYTDIWQHIHFIRRGYAPCLHK